MREWLTRVYDWLRRARLDDELTEELRFHRQQLERDAIVAGATPDEARHAARRRLGSEQRVKEAARTRWSVPWLDRALRDVRYAARGLRRSPGFTTTVIVTLGLGIGANVAMFGVVDRLMFRPYAYLQAPERVHRIYLRATVRGKTDWGYGDEYTRYLDLRRFTSSFDLLAGFTSRQLAIGSGDASRERRVAAVSASFWPFFDARPALGRFFTAAEDSTPRGAAVAVLGHAFWKREMGGRDVLGERLQVGDIQTTIIGVAPEGFAGVFESAPAVYIPITLYAGSAAERATYYTNYNWGWMETMARRRPEVSVTQANADVTQAFRRSWQAQYEMEKGGETVAQAQPNGVVGPMKSAAGPDAPLEARTALWVSGVAAIVLLIACANVANLSLARALRRQRETALRLALGVSRRRLVAQALTESLLLALLGGAVGMLVAQWGGAVIRRLLIETQEASLDTFTDWRTLAAALAIALATGVFAGATPALLVGRGTLAPTLRAGPREGTHQRSGVRATLLVAQGALSVVLLVGATLFVRSLRHVERLRLGYDAEHVLLASFNMRGVTLDSARQAALRRDLLAKAQSIPGVVSAATVSSVPLQGTSSMGLYVPGIDSVRRIGRFTYQVSTPDYFRTFGTRVVRGRAYAESDREGAPLVALVSEAMARALWPGHDPIGQCMHVGRRTAPCTTVIGVAEDIVQRREQLTDARRFQYYLPLAQFGPTREDTHVMLRMVGAPQAHAEAVREALQTVMPGQSYVKVRPAFELVDATRRSWQLGAHLFVVFGGLALVVAAVGLYGVMAYNVAQRMHELGVRVALGARAPDIVRLVASQGARFAVAGVLLGSALALAASRWVEPLLFQQSATDPVVYAGVAVLMLAVALLASASPAMRATTADPNAALRAE